MISFLQIIVGIILGSVYAVSSVGFTLILGVMEIPNFAHGAIYMFAAHIFWATFMVYGLNILAAFSIALAVTTIICALIEFLLLRPLYKKRFRSFLIMIETFAIATFLEVTAGLLWGHSAKYIVIPIVSTTFLTIPFIEVSVSYVRLLVIGVAFICIILLQAFVQKTYFGKAIRAAVQNREAAALVGVNPNRVFTLTFMLGGCLTSISGILGGILYSVSPPMGWSILIKSFIVVVVAGVGNIGNALLASIGLGLLEAILVNFVSPEVIYAYEFGILIIYFVLKFAWKHYKMRRGRT